MIESGALSRLQRSRILSQSLAHISPRIFAITGAASALLTIAAVTQGYPLYIIVAFSLLPWLPMFLLETLWQYRNFNWLAVFFVITVLQTGHLGEHAVQVAQMYLYDGALVHSHGVFGQLDFETVHFLWDTAAWLGALGLIWRYGRTNGWLWVSLAFLSLHTSEHIYLYYVNVQEPYFYGHGGAAGILGKGGVLPTIERPYLHFFYNFMIVVPTVIAYVKQLLASIEPMLARTGAA